ncbi:hypothetical protein [Paenibacillus pini]
MNIGSLIRGLLGETKAGEAKQLDMKAGQVVRGVVLSVSDDGQEAVVQIQGVKVRATLETPLQAGQATLLQVQEPGEGGMVMLKPLAESPYISIPTQSLANVLESFGLQDTQGNRDLLQAIQSSGVPLTKENIALFKEVMALKPALVSAEKWIQSAAIAFQRGLPMTSESIKGLHQAVFGPPMHELLGVLEEQLTAVMTSASSQTGKMNPSTGGLNSTLVKTELTTQSMTGKSEPNTATSNALTPQSAATGQHAASTQSAELQPLAAKLQNVLQQLRTLPLQAAPANPAAAGAPALAAQQGTQAAAIAPQPSSVAGMAMPPAETAAPQGSAAALAQPTQAAPTASEGTAVPSQKTPLAHGEQPWVGRLLKLLGAEHEQQAVRGAATPAPQGQSAAIEHARPQAAAASQPAAAVNLGAATGAPQTTQPSATPTGVALQAAASQQAAAPISPGLEHLTRASAQQGVAHSTAAALNDITAVIHSEHSLSADGEDTLKGVLLQLVRRDDVPPVLREAAQQLIQSLTGQQLLLNTDRTAPFAQVTMFIPLNGPDGQETASVQIQSRRGKKGELDASNCHLWFDLQMKHLGQTLIDVQVVDQIVSLKVHNDNDWAAPLLEERRDEISSAMESLGYHLLTLKAGPLPVLAAKNADGITSPNASDFVPQTYKGVDMRI